MGELLWLDADAPLLPGAFPAYHRVAAALDTGSAIKGDSRADLYLGEGDAAGEEAGRIRHTLRLYRLDPVGPTPNDPAGAEGCAAVGGDRRHGEAPARPRGAGGPARADRRRPSPPSRPRPSGRRCRPPRRRRTHTPVPRRPSGPPETIEPNRLRLIDRGREPLAGTVDLHDLDQDRARAALTGFLLRAFEENHRTVLVVTGKGALGDGILRRRTPEWLAEPPLRSVVAGVSEAHRARGGAGALYVALKRNPRRGG